MTQCVRFLHKMIFKFMLLSAPLSAPFTIVLTIIYTLCSNNIDQPLIARAVHARCFKLNNRHTHIPHACSRPDIIYSWTTAVYTMIPRTIQTSSHSSLNQIGILLSWLCTLLRDGQESLVILETSSERTATASLTAWYSMFLTCSSYTQQIKWVSLHDRVKH